MNAYCSRKFSSSVSDGKVYNKISFLTSGSVHAGRPIPIRWPTDQRDRHADHAGTGRGRHHWGLPATKRWRILRIDDSLRSHAGGFHQREHLISTSVGKHFWWEIKFRKFKNWKFLSTVKPGSKKMWNRHFFSLLMQEINSFCILSSRLEQSG